MRYTYILTEFRPVINKEYQSSKKQKWLTGSNYIIHWVIQFKDGRVILITRRIKRMVCNTTIDDFTHNFYAHYYTYTHSRYQIYILLKSITIVLQTHVHTMFCLSFKLNTAGCLIYIWLIINIFKYLITKTWSNKTLFLINILFYGRKINVCLFFPFWFL